MGWIAAFAGLWLFFRYLIPLLVLAIVAYVIYRWIKGQTQEFTSSEPRDKQRRD